jgi:hypothetical protein
MRHDAPQKLIIPLTFTVIKSGGLVQSVSELLDFSHEGLILAIALWLRSGLATILIGHGLYIFRLATICFDLLQLMKVSS